MSQLKVSSIVDTAGGNTVTINGATPTQYNTMGKNRIINGDCRIDQRNAGAAVTTTGSFPVDRFFINKVTDGAFSAQQDSSAPTGFVNSVKVTITTADASLSDSQYLFMNQWIEGTSVYDLAWGTASAKTVTVSFWVRSSLTGTFGGALRNGDNNRSYPFTYTISTADTWEQKSVTIPGDTTGTWLTTNGRGAALTFGLGVGSTYSGTAGAWAGSNYLSATGATSVIGTLNATWYITGVQLEVGSVATEFERRPYGTELALCQRYYESTAFPDVTFGITSCRGSAVIGGGGAGCGFSFLVAKRTNSPTVTLYSRNGNSGKVSNNATGGDLSGTSSANQIGGTGFLTITMGETLSAGACIEAGWTASAEL